MVTLDNHTSRDQTPEPIQESRPTAKSILPFRVKANPQEVLLEYDVTMPAQGRYGEITQPFAYHARGRPGQPGFDPLAGRILELMSMFTTLEASVHGTAKERDDALLRVKELEAQLADTQRKLAAKGGRPKEA